MRKKLLRSRSGFEKPESREEAIMQNILGASNVLEPSESNIEEILKSILYNTPYTKEAEFEIEKILLAIKNNGTYDGEGESRDTKILIAILNDLDYTEEAESRIEELFIEWLHQRSSIKVLEGIPPLTFTSLGQPLINYLIEGNTIQNGTPTPDSPIMPQGTGERTGNWFDEIYPDLEQESTVKYKPIFVGDGVFTLSTDCPLVQAGTADLFLLSGNVSSGASTVANGVYFGQSRTFSSVGGYVTIGYRKYSATHPLLSDYRTMLNTGSTALPYEPYGYKIPISSANTTTPVYLGEVETTRKIKKSVLTGEEAWVKSGAYQGSFYAQIVVGILSEKYAAYCSHLTFTTLSRYAKGNFCFNGGATKNCNLWFNQFDSSTTVEDLKSYLAAQYAAGTPVTIWYVLANEETAVVNEPLMRIGDYADTLSKEQTGVEIPTVSGSNTLDVNTTVKPSNIYIEYK